ncbi:hypothetical protein NHQ30_009711 [Ciborinia camelliae]|nr:hypothetical protein NHQ30_009711 [Ciborinia camelliae]
MLFSKAATVCLLTLCGYSTALPSSSNAIDKRTAASDVTLFAYGANINGKPVFYSDGKAYIGTTPPTGASDSVNVTFTTENIHSATEKWTISANITSGATAPFTDSSLSLYIIPTANSFEQVGFASATAVPTGGVTEGFILFGKQLAYEASKSDIEVQFWAKSVSGTDTWGLYWYSDADMAELEGSIPVVIKTMPPTSTDSKSTHKS